MKTVELVQAFAWTCEECGTDHFARAVTVPPEAIEEMLSPGEVFPTDGDGEYVMAPERVTCPDCGTEYETTEPGQELF